MLISVCFLISNQFENKEGKKNDAALLLLVSHQEESPNLWSEIKTDFHVVRSIIFFMEAVMSLLLDLLLVD